MPAEQFILTLVTSITTGLVVAWVTIHLSLRRFRAERVWDRKVDAYQTVLVALHDARRHCSSEYANYVSMSHHQPSEAESRKTGEAYAEIYKAMDLCSFLLSEKAAPCLNILKDGLKEASANEEDYLGYLEDAECAINDCLKSLQDIATEDIKKLPIFWDKMPRLPWRRGHRSGQGSTAR